MSPLFLTVAAVLLAGMAGLFALSLTARRPTGLGVTDRRLADCPPSPNCVCTQTDDSSHWIAPLTYTGDSAAVIPRLRQIVTAMPRTRVVQQTDDFLYVEFRSAVFRFVDDVEFLLEPESGRVHFRSASRVGHSDLGVNRARMESIRSRFRELTRAESGKSSTAAAAAMAAAGR